MNNIILIGNVCKDAEIHETTNGVKKASFILAVNRRFTNAQGNREADFIPVVAWKERAEFAEKYLSKGKKICVSGSLQSRSYNTQDGATRNVLEVIAEDFEFITPKSEGEKQHNTQKPAQQEMTPAEDDPDLPF